MFHTPLMNIDRNTKNRIKEIFLQHRNILLIYLIKTGHSERTMHGLADVRPRPNHHNILLYIDL